VLAKLQQSDRGFSENGSIQHLCIPTYKRPDSLKRCIDGFAIEIRARQRSDMTITIVDDSDDATSRANNSRVIHAACLNHSIHIDHIDLDARARFVQLLARHTAIPIEVIKFAIAPERVLPTYGAARNTLLLLTAGYKMLQTDDDTVCSYVPAENQSAGLRCSSRADPCDTTFLADHLSAAKNVAQIDPFSCHELYLGKRLNALNAAPFQCDAISSDVAASVQAGPARLGITSTGCYGASGRFSNLGFVFSDSPRTLDQMCNHEGSLDSVLSSNNVFKTSSSATLSRTPYLQAMSIGVDNRELLPPFFPVGRNEDGTFALLYLRTDLQSWIVHLPWAIVHDCPTLSSEVVDCYVAASSIRLTDIVRLCIESCRLPAPIGRAAALKYFGYHFQSLGRLHAKGFTCLLYTSPSPRDLSTSRMPSSA